LLRAMMFWQDHLKEKILLKVIFEWQGIVDHQFIPKSVTINKGRYKEVLTCLWGQCVWRILKCVDKRLDLLHDNSWHIGCCPLTIRLWCFLMHCTLNVALWNFCVFLCAKDWLKDCDFNVAADVQLALKIVVQQVAHSGFQISADCIAAEKHSEYNCIRGFLGTTDWRYGFCPETVWSYQVCHFQLQKAHFQVRILDDGWWSPSIFSLNYQAACELLHLLILSSHLCLSLPSGLFASHFWPNIVCIYPPMHATCWAHILLYLIILIILMKSRN
jgi:hypothetical protein